MSKAITYNMNGTNAELLQLNDPEYCVELYEKLIKPHNISDEQLIDIGWLVHMSEGETSQYPFGLLKAMKNQMSSSTGLSEEDLQKCKDFDLSVMINVPYFFSLHVMPLNFTEFWPLAASIDDYREGPQSYEKTKWKLAFQKYIEKLPPYYNDYLNSYLKYLKAPQLLLPSSEQIILSRNSILTQLFKELNAI